MCVCTASPNRNSTSRHSAGGEVIPICRYRYGYRNRLLSLVDMSVTTETILCDKARMER